MEQIESLQNLFRIEQLNFEKKIYGTKINDIILIFLGVLTFLNMLGVFYPLTILLTGIIFPKYCQMKKIQIQHYWFYLVLILWLRTFTYSISAFDGILIISLWHPNIQLGKKINNQFEKLIKDKNISQLLKNQ